MLTRAYDAIMAAIQTPMITNQNVDFNNTTIDDSILNCKTYNGYVRTIYPNSYFTGSTFQGSSISGYCLLYTSPSPRDYLGSRMPSSA